MTTNETKLMEANLNAVYAALTAPNKTATQAWCDVLTIVAAKNAEASQPPKSLVERCNVEFDDQGHHEHWRNQCARDLNAVLDQVTKAIESGNAEDQRFADAALRIVERVAEFEQITEVDEKQDAADAAFYAQCEPHQAGEDERD